MSQVKLKVSSLTKSKMRSPSLRSVKGSLARRQQQPTMGTLPGPCRTSTTIGCICISSRLRASCSRQQLKQRGKQQSGCFRCNLLEAPSIKMKVIKLNLPSSLTPPIASLPWKEAAPQYFASIVVVGRRAIDLSIWHCHVSHRTMANVTACASFSVGSCRKKVQRSRCTLSSSSDGRAGGEKADGDYSCFSN